MKILFHLGHPAHFHLFKNVIKSLKENGHQTHILIKKKDVLEDLLRENKFDYQNILPHGRKNNKISIVFSQLKQNIKMFSFCIKNKPDILIGTSVAISHVGKLLNIPSLNLTEDDIDVVPLYAKLTYPWATYILVPHICRMGKWIDKTIFYNSYHELAYLHPNNFTPNVKVLKKYISIEKEYFILRFAKLSAHHDIGIRGISDNIAHKLVKKLIPYGQVYITSERKLSTHLESYRIQINPNDIHHIMAFAKIYIGDSQTMAAEAGVLGVPFVRFNDFVGRISYLEELENEYKLGFGIKTNEPEKLIKTIKKILEQKNYKEVYQNRRNKMLSEKINYADFLTWFVENYPKSVAIMRENPNFQDSF